MLKQVVTLSLRTTVSEDDFFRYIHDVVYAQFPDEKCDFEFWKTEPESRSETLYHIEVTYFDSPEYDGLRGFFRNGEFSSYIGSSYSFETYRLLIPGSSYRLTDFNGTRTPCSLQNCPKPVNTNSAKRCTNNGSHYFGNHKLKYCPECQSGTQHSVH